MYYNYHMKKALVISLSVLALLGALVTYFLLSGGPERLSWSEEPKATASIQAEDEPTPVQHDARALEALNEVGYKGSDLKDLNVLYRDQQDLKTICDWDDAYGCYLNEFLKGKSLYVSEGDSKEDFHRIVAHEYLHYIFEKERLGRNQELVDALYSLYQNNAYLNSRIVSHYHETTFDVATELFSYGCTELSDQELGFYIGGYCNNYIDTSLLTDFS